jgi:CHAT domain-containing protein/Tfp pilus assembly protein PilF
MKPIAVTLILLSSFLSKVTFAQTNSNASHSDANAGVVVESLVSKFEAERAGLQVGDVLLKWSLDETTGDIHSPFDLLEVAVEKSTLGPIRLAGLRGTEPKAWVLKPNRWGLTVRPNFSGRLLLMYEKDNSLAGTPVPTEIVQRSHRFAAEAHRAESSQLSQLAAWFLYNGAEQLTDARQWKEADVLYREAIDQIAASPRFSQQLWIRWGDRSAQHNDWDNAANCYRQVIAEGRESGIQTLTIAQALNNLANVAWARDELEDAEAAHKQALQIRTKLAPGSLAVAASLNNLGLIDRRRGDLTAAAERYRQMLGIAEKRAPDSLYIAAILNNLANVNNDRGELDEAERYALKALEIQERLAPGSIELSYIANNVGNIAYGRGDLTRAESYYRRALAIREKLAPGGLDVASSLNNLGQVAEARSDLKEAESLYRQALTIKERLAPDTINLANTLFNLSVIARQRGDLASAKQHQNRALTIRNKIAPGSIDVASSLHILGSIAQDEGDLASAKQDYRQALAIWEKLAPDSTNHAETLFALASTVQRAPDAGGETVRLEEAAELFHQAVKVLEHQTAHLSGTEEIRAGFRAKFDGYYKNYIDLLVAIKQPDAAFQVLESSRARSLLETLAAARVDIRKGVDPALVQRERDLHQSLSAKSSRRLQLLAGQHTDQQIATLDKEIGDLLARYQDVQQEIRVRSPDYAALTQPRPLETKELQRLLGSNTLLLEYSLGREHSHLFVVTATSLNVYRLARRSQIEAAARRVHDLLTAPNVVKKGETPHERQLRLGRAEAEYANAAAQLSEMVVSPAAKHLRQNRLLIVAEGALNYVPFAALPVSAAGHLPSPLVAKHEIVSLPSASVLSVLRANPPTRAQRALSVAVLADPVFDQDDVRVTGGRPNRRRAESGVRTGMAASAQPAETGESLSFRQMARAVSDAGWGSGRNGEVYLPRLPFTRREAEAIAAVTPPNHLLKALDFNASRATAVSPDLAHYRILHLATHALINNSHPELSGLVLSLVTPEGKAQNGFLGLQDIYNLNLPVDLVVLSACETGLGKRIEGEGLVGLTRGFMYAGASGVVASLWKIDDLATAELMGYFYAALERRHMKPAAALRAAQLQIAKQKRWNLPYYWAAFQIQGE